MVQPINNGVAADGSQKEHGGGPLISEIVGLPEVQHSPDRPDLDRRPSTLSSSSVQSDATSLASGHSVGSGMIESDLLSSGVGGGLGGAGSADTAAGPQGEARPMEAEGGGTKRTLATDDARMVETQQQPASQQLRKACDLCTKRKRKCNGQHPCSQCIETGMRNQCIYSPRLKSGRKKKIRIDGVLYEEGSYGADMALVPNGGGNTRRHASIDPSVGRFSASGAVGLAGHVENFFLATYLRDFNRIVPLTSESSVTEGMLEVLSPAISSRGLATANPIKQPENRRQAKLAVFWGVVAMGSRILGANDESTVRYLGLMRSALRECFDCNDKEVVQAYLLLSTVETMRGNEAAGKRYLDHAHTMHNANATGPGGNLLKDRSEQDESLDLVFQIYDQPDGSISGFNRSAAVAEWRRNLKRRNADKSSYSSPPSSSDSASSDSSSASSTTGSDIFMESDEPSSAVDQMIAQAMAPPSESQSSPLKALKYLSTACGLSSEVFDPTNKCVTVKQYLSEMDSALKGAHSLFVATDLGECVTGVMMVKIWGGVTVVMRSWGNLGDRNIGLQQVEEGVGYALTRPGLFTFPMWWHALHTAAVTLAHFGRADTYMRLRATFNKNTFPGTEMPPFESYSPGAVCPQLGGSCSKLAYWLQVRGTMCAEPEWKPHFAKGRLSEASENAAYAAALDRGSACGEKMPMMKTGGENGAAALGLTEGLQPNAMDGADLVDGSSLRAALDAGLNEIGAQFDDLGGLEMMGASDLDLDPLGVEFDLSDLTQDPPETAAAGAVEAGVGSGGLAGDARANPCLEASRAMAAAEVASALAKGKVPGARSNSSMQVPPNLVAGRGGSSSAAAAPAPPAQGAGTPAVAGGGELSRDPSFGIAGWAGGATPTGISTGGDLVSRQSSIDINTIMQMATSDEKLKENEGGTPDAIDTALAFGEGPAKEIFGVELSST